MLLSMAEGYIEMLLLVWLGGTTAEEAMRQVKDKDKEILCVDNRRRTWIADRITGTC